MKKFLFLLVLLSTFVAAVHANDKTDVMKAATAAVAALKNKNMTRLATLVHPVKGVRFSAYGYIDKDKDLVFKKAQVAGLWNNRRVYNWGEYDGSGDLIKLRFSRYYAEFVYDRDFVRAPHISYNQRLGGGNTIVNVEEAYPKAKFVEYHFSQSPDGNVMGWASLRLVFERSGRTWYLVGICHDEWTI